MPSNIIVIPINIKQKRNALSKCFGHYFPEVHCRGALSTYGFKTRPNPLPSREGD